MAAGGQGAPLVPYADWALFTHPTRPRIIQNIGGIGNLTFLPPRATLGDVIAFDTGPGNMVMDALVAALTRGRQTFDRDGRLAARGRVSEKLLAEMLSHPFLRRRPPKTTGREEFGELFVGRLLSSARRLRLRPKTSSPPRPPSPRRPLPTPIDASCSRSSNAAELRRLQIILGGGGAKKPHAAPHVGSAPRRGRAVDARGFRHRQRRQGSPGLRPARARDLAREPGNVPSATGARRAVVLGKIVPG